MTATNASLTPDSATPPTVAEPHGSQPGDSDPPPADLPTVDTPPPNPGGVTQPGSVDDPPPNAAPDPRALAERQKTFIGLIETLIEARIIRLKIELGLLAPADGLSQLK